jgi:hypothetical protein
MVADDVLSAASPAEQLTAVTPSGNWPPDTGVHGAARH